MVPSQCTPPPPPPPPPPPGRSSGGIFIFMYVYLQFNVQIPRPNWTKLSVVGWVDAGEGFGLIEASGGDIFIMYVSYLCRAILTTRPIGQNCHGCWLGAGMVFGLIKMVIPLGISQEGGGGKNFFFIYVCLCLMLG